MPHRNEHVIAIMLEPIAVGHEFIEWPLHITIVPWFPCDDKKRLDELLASLSAKQKKFNVRVGGVEMFGFKKNVKVSVIEDNPKLNKLHAKVLSELDKNNFPVHQREFVAAGYRPHITHQTHGHFRKGGKLEVTSMTLVKQVRLKKTGVMVKTVDKHYKLAA